jgi:lysophospholipid acyltransferase (LPLAT)-like uncharacterized protein
LKAFLRSGAVQGALAFVTWAYLWLVLKTVRWKHLDADSELENLPKIGAAIGCIWHGTIPMVIAVKPMIAGREARILISLSPDGEFITQAAARHNMVAIRGSSAKGDKAKGGAAAFRECLDWLAGGGMLLVTPDGPRGPAEQMSMGVVRMARLSQTPVYMLGLAADPVFELNSWDRTKLPRPFGRGAIAWAGPFTAPADASEQDLTRLRLEWAAALTGACERAKAALA